MSKKSGSSTKKDLSYSKIQTKTFTLSWNGKREVARRKYTKD
jgi:hypothetical protein